MLSSNGSVGGDIKVMGRNVCGRVGDRQGLYVGRYQWYVVGVDGNIKTMESIRPDGEI